MSLQEDRFSRVFQGFWSTWQSKLPAGVQAVRCLHCEQLLLQAWDAGQARGWSFADALGPRDRAALQVPYSAIVDGHMVVLMRRSPWLPPTYCFQVGQEALGEL